MKVSIYEDNEKDLKILIDYLQKFSIERDIKFEIITCNSAAEVFKHALESDVLFLDIEGLEENGIDIGIKIRNINYDLKIIFISSYSKYSIDGYRALASRYFVKPLQWSFFEIEFGNVISDYLFKTAGFTDTSIFPRKIYYHEILFVEFIGRKTLLHLTSGKVIFTNYSLKYWIEKLSDYDFAQSYKSFYVNLRLISNITDNEIIMNNNESIPLSRLYKKDFNDKYIECLRRRL